MKRTYRSKKDVAGALDHKDILNFNDKNSVFDAFYIQNLKQTKRELSYVSTNQYVAASKNIRKRKYTKRIVKNVNSISKDSSPLSACLTPDKSIRVNKAFDPFDALLNSSLNTQTVTETNKKNLSKNVHPQRERKAYTRQKKKNKLKRFNYSSTDSDSEKENSGELSNISHNKSDIRKHELLIEKEAKISNHITNESINNIVFNVPILNNLKQNDVNDSLRKYGLTRVSLTGNIQSPISQHSPFSSTPFKEKYRSQSIYKFSPILKNFDSSSNTSAVIEKSIIHNSNEIHIDENKDSPESEPQLHKTPIRHLSNVSVNLTKANLLPLTTTQRNSSAQLLGLEKIIKVHEHNLSNYIQLHTCIDVSSLHTTEAEPFFGFNSNLDNHFKATTEQNKRNKVIQNADKLCAYDSKSSEISQSIIHIIDEDNYKEKTMMQKSKSQTEINDTNSTLGDSIKFNVNTEDKKNYCIHSERQTLYDTCNNESLQAENKSNFREPIVRLERLDDSIFFAYHKKIMNISENDKSINRLTDEESNEFVSFQQESTLSESNSIEFDGETSSTNEVTESSIMESDEISSSDEPIKCTNEEERCKNFVTTRKRTKQINSSVRSGTENTSYNGSIEFDQTVCNNLTDNRTVCFNVSKVNAEDSIDTNSNEEMSTLHDRTEKSISLKENSSKESSITGSDETNYYDNDSTDDTINTLASKKKLSIKNYSLHAERTRKRISRISRIMESQNTLEHNNHHNYKQNIDDEIEVISSDSAPEKFSNLRPIKDRLLRLSEKNKDDSNNVNTTTSDEENNEVSLYAFPPNVLDSDDTDSSHSGVKTSFSITKKNKRVTSKYAKEYDIVNKVEQTNIPINNNETLNSKDEAIQETFSDECKDYDDLNSKRKTISKDNPAASTLSKTDIKPSIVLEPGKKWERSLSIYRRMTMMADKLNHSILEEPMQMKGRKYRQSVISTMEMQDFRGSLHNESISNHRNNTFISKPSRSTIKFLKDPNITRVSLYTTAVYDDLKGFLSDDCDDTIVELSKLSIADAEPDVTVLEVQNTSNRLTTARDYVLRRCNQTDAILFDECYPDTVLKNCHKIGEGVYGEVFLWRDRDGRARVMKIVPIAGHVKVNGECQKDFHEIISEIVIAMELSALRAPIADIERHFDEGKSIDALDLHSIENATDVFNEVLAVRCVYGNYPSRLLDLWDLYDECKGSENDNPAVLPVDQQYLVLELANAGLDLESYQFNNAEQAHALFLQVAFGLAVGEEAYQFEHRDLHWGNVLIAPTDQKFATFVLRGRGHRVARCGVSATIIDYSLSRIALPLGSPADCAALYNDLAADDNLFDAVGDYQFEVYRLMRDKLGNDWKNFEPYTNILWLHYVVDKMITALRYKRTNTKIHKHYIDKLKSIKNRILDYKSAVEFVLTDNEF